MVKQWGGFGWVGGAILSRQSPVRPYDYAFATTRFSARIARTYARRRDMSVPQEQTTMGVPSCESPQNIGLPQVVTRLFREPRDDWEP